MNRCTFLSVQAQLAQTRLSPGFSLHRILSQLILRQFLVISADVYDVSYFVRWSKEDICPLQRALLVILYGYQIHIGEGSLSKRHLISQWLHKCEGILFRPIPNIQQGSCGDSLSL